MFNSNIHKNTINDSYKDLGNITNFDNSKKVNEITRKDIEKSINIDDSHGTEAYYSNRYGWTLRKIIY